MSAKKRVKDTIFEDHEKIPIENEKEEKIEHRKVKFPIYLDENGNFYKNKKKQKVQFYDDLNFGDFVIKMKAAENEVNNKMDLKNKVSFLGAFRTYNENIFKNSDI